MENVAKISKISKARLVTYWILTGYLAFESVLSATWDFDWLNKGFTTTIMHHLGYPPYFQIFKGFATLMAAPVFVLPGLPLLKEWAYFGTFIIYTGAIASHLAMGDGAFAFVGPILFLSIAVTSWALRPESRRLK